MKHHEEYRAAFVYIADSVLQNDEMQSDIYLIDDETGAILLKESVTYSVFGGNDEEISYIVRCFLVHARKYGYEVVERSQ